MDIFDDVFTNPDALHGEIDTLYTELMRKAEGVYCDAGYKDVVMHPNLAGILAHEAVRAHRGSRFGAGRFGSCP